MARLLAFDGFVFISALGLLGYLVGFNKFLRKHGDNGCDMTYMYEYPQFVKVSLPSNVTAEYRRYGLYAYSEGRQTQQTRNMQFSGIPVLFIPGQGGSFKQVRSLASVSLRKSLSSDLPFHFDFFTLDLNEEYSAMFGGVLPDQTRFAVHAVQRILTLYKRVRPDSIVLIGHSMGGMIAKGLFLESDFPSHAVRLVVTLATPHSPVVLIDPLIRDYFQRVVPPGPNVTVVSLGGGVKDLVVRSGLALTKTADISVLTTAVSEVWMSVDHLCILWCKQLVLVLVRSLFDCVDPYTNQISQDSQFRLEVFKYHLLERSAGKHYLEADHPLDAILQTSRTEWLELTRPRHTILRHSLHQPLHLLIHIPPAPAPEDTLAVATMGHKARDWLYACARLTIISGGQRVCTTVENLSVVGRIAPTKHKKHKVALINMEELRARGLHYVVVRLPPSDEPTSVSYDMFSSVSRAVPVALPRPLPPLQWNTLLTTTGDEIFYTLDMPQLERPWHAFHLSITARECSNNSHQAVATLRVPWSHQHNSVILRNSAEAILPVLLHTSRPTDWKGPGPYVVLHLDPKCQYTIQIHSSITELLAQLVRLYSGHILAYMAAILLLTLSEQLRTLGTKQHCLLFHHALLQGAKPYYILPTVKIASNFLSWPIIPESLRALLPIPDLTTLSQSGLDFFMLPLFLYCVAFSFVFFLGLLFYLGVVCSGATVNKIALKFVGKLAGVSRTWTDWLLVVVDKVPFVVSVAMVAILMSSCGGLAMLIGTVYYFMRVCGMYEDYIEQLFFAPLKYLKDVAAARWRGRQLPEVNEVVREAEDLLSLKGLTEFNFHMTLVLLWGTATIVHLPSVLVWAHNFRYNPVLELDPATMSALVSSVCAAVLWTLNSPICSDYVEGETYKQMSSVMFGMACVVLTYCPISVYNLPMLVAVSFVCLAVHQLYEKTVERWQRLQNSEVTVSNNLSDSAHPSDEESEDENTGKNEAIENLPDSDKEDKSSPERSEESEQAGTVSKNRKISDISVSSYEAEPQIDAKANGENKEEPNIMLLQSEQIKDDDSEEEEEGDEEENEEDEAISDRTITVKEQIEFEKKVNNREQFKKKRLPPKQHLRKNSDEDLSE